MTACIWLVGGERRAGKTSFCRALANHARSQGWDVAGLLSPAMFAGEHKTGIRVQNLRTGESRPLASAAAQAGFDLQLGDWFFDRSSLEWGNRILQNSLPCDLLIVDELGPLELNRGEGWQAALDVLRRGHYRLAMAVVRPELQAAMLGLFHISRTIAIDRMQSAEKWVALYWPEIGASKW